MRLFLFRNFDFMRRLLLVLVVVLFTSASFGQTDFCVPGARWIFSEWGNGYYLRDIFVEYVGDTAVYGQSTVHVLKVHSYFDPYDFAPDYYQWFEYVYIQNDSVFQWSDSFLWPSEPEWQFMYDYNVVQGDIRIVYVADELKNEGMYEMDTMRIDSVYFTSNYQTSWNGGELVLKAVDYTLLISDQNQGELEPHCLQGTYFERIGKNIRHAQSIFSCDQWPVPYYPPNLRCYSDDDHSLNCSRPNWVSVESDYDLAQKASATIFDDRLLIKNAEGCEVIVYGILGKELYQTSVNSDNQTIDLSGLPNGVLLIVCENSEFRITKKVVRFSN